MANEKRLIDANVTKAIIQKEMNKSDFQPFKDVMQCVCNILDYSDTVDAVELPCRPGDHVFRLCGTKKHRYVGERIVSAVTLCGNGSWTIHSTADDALGRTVFLTREEAERAIAKMDGDGNG